MRLIILTTVPRSLPHPSRSKQRCEISKNLRLLKFLCDILEVDGWIILCCFSPGVAQITPIIQLLHDLHTLRWTDLQLSRNQLLSFDRVQRLRPILLCLLLNDSRDFGQLCILAVLYKNLNNQLVKKLSSSPGEWTNFDLAIFRLFVDTKLD